ncbi:MAG: hypothetical protein ACRD11_16400, partial [Terriglobia bacterium]
GRYLLRRLEGGRGKQRPYALFSFFGVSQSDSKTVQNDTMSEFFSNLSEIIWPNCARWCAILGVFISNGIVSSSYDFFRLLPTQTFFLAAA